MYKSICTAFIFGYISIDQSINYKMRFKLHVNRIRVTKQVCEKVAQNEAQAMFWSK
jgi:hypothetical protein